MKTLLTLGLSLTLAFAGVLSHAAPPALSGTVGAKTGVTKLTFDTLFTNELALFGVSVSALDPASAPVSKVSLRLPIEGGAFDLNSLQSQTLHDGGLVLRSNGVKVVITNWIVETPTEGATTANISALFIVDGQIQGRIRFLKLDLSGSGLTGPLVPGNSKRIDMLNIVASLSGEAAAAIDAAFGTTNFSGDRLVGTLNVKIVAANKR